MDACRQLGAVARQCSLSFQTKIANARLFVPAYTFKQLNPPAYFGALFTPGAKGSSRGYDPDESGLLIWCGVSVTAAYVLKPRQKNVSELHAGIALWIDRTMGSSAIEPALAGLSNLEQHGFSIHDDDDDETLVRSAVLRSSFLELQMAEDTTAAAVAFFTRAFAALESLDISTYTEFRRVTNH